MIDWPGVSALPGKIFLFGVNSIVGWSIARLLSGAQDQVELFCNRHTRIPPGARWRRLNLQDDGAVGALFAREHPDVIIHCAGVCDVEKCETSPQFAHEVNVGGMKTLLARAPAAARIVYLSSDHVFSGDTGPYTESSPVDPMSVYGRTRVVAETLLLARRPSALVVRGGLWIGPSYNGRIGHMDWLRYRRSRGLPMTVVADEHRSAVWAEEAAGRVLDLTASPITGVRHVVATRTTARPALARYLNERFAIGATFSVHSRKDRSTPHLGRVELHTEFTDALAAPLTPVVL